MSQTKQYEGLTEPVEIKNWTELKIHPIAHTFPPMSESEQEGLEKSILEIGVQQPIILYEDQIADGRHRYPVCKKHGVEPRFERFKEGVDPMPLLMAHNLERRHLNESQRSLVGARWRNYQQSIAGGNGEVKAEEGEAEAVHGPTILEAAEKLNVSDKSITFANLVEEKGSAKLKKAVEQGQVKISDAAAVAKQLPKSEQDEALAKVLSEEAKTLREAAGLHTPDKASKPARDAAGTEIPPKLKDFFGMRLVDDTLKNLTELAKFFKKHQRHAKWLKLGDLEKHATLLSELLEAGGKPGLVHTACDGKGCDVCRGSGWLPLWKAEELAKDK